MHCSYYKRPLLLLLVLYIGLLVCWYKPGPSASDISHFISPEPVCLQGKVVGFPAAKKKTHNVLVQVQQVNGQKVSGYLYARFPSAAPAWHETLLLCGQLKKPYSVALLGNFDWAAYLATKNVFTEMTVQSVQTLTPPAWPLRLIYTLRQDILATFERHFDRDLSAIAGGILLGERGEIDPQLYSNFQDSGAIHLLVASGGNVGFVTLVVFACCSLFGLSRKKTALAALAVAGVYTVLAGADAPLTRAYFMTVCAVAGYFLRRNSGVFQGLVLSCLVILLVHPAAVFETGFQMSFLATLAIVVCLNLYEIPYTWPRWVRFFAQIFLATLSTQLVLLPVFTNVFYKVSFAGLLANMVLVPLASLLMGLSFLFYIFCVLHLAFVLQWVTGAALLAFKWLVEFFAAWPLANVPAAAWSPGWVAAYYAGVFGLFHLRQKQFLRRVGPVLLAGMLLAPALQYFFFSPPTVWLLNEWNKNAILYRTSHGKRILVAPALDGEKLARAVLKSGARRVDWVLLSEDTPKQRQQVQALQQRVEVGQVVRPFAQVWPGEEMQAAGVSVKVLWGQLLNRQNKVWTNAGFSGGRDSVSYEITDGNITFITAANGRFVLYLGQVLDNQRNATRRLSFPL